MGDLETLNSLIQTHGIERGHRILHSGKETELFFDIERVLYRYAGMEIIGKSMTELIAPMKPTAVGGPAMGAIPIVCGILSNSQLRGFYTYQGNICGGSIDTPDRVVVVDDVATTGESLEQVCVLLDRMGVDVVGCAVVVDREEGAAGRLTEAWPLRSLYKVSG